MMVDYGRDLFDELQSARWALVEGWLTRTEPETLHLEFKLKENPSTPTIDDADKKQVARTLSAFANTEGGLLVLGIDAGGGTHGGFDRVTRIAPIANVETFGGALERRLRSFTEPPIAGLRVTSVENPGTRTGVVGVYVPRSNGGPHRVVGATSDSNERYYMRTASGAQTISHSLLGERQY
jgi:predicted HTH transcriptional regulator